MRKAALRLAQLALTVAVTWFIADRLGLGLAELRGLDLSHWRPKPLVLAASILVLIAGYVLSAALWGRMVTDLGGPALPAHRSVRLFMVANLGRYVPGKVWQIAGLAMLAKRDGVPPGIATGAAVLGQGFALVGATLIGLGAFFGANQAWRAAGWTLGALVATLALAIFVPALFGRLLGAWFRLTGEEAPARLEGRSTFGLRWVALYVLNWGIYATAFWLLYLSFGEFRTFLQIGSAFAAGYVAGYVAFFAPAGVGIREASMVGFLTPVMSAESATVLAVVARVWTTVVELVPAAIFALGETRLGSGRAGEAAEDQATAGERRA